MLRLASEERNFVAGRSRYRTTYGVDLLVTRRECKRRRVHGDARDRASNPQVSLIRHRAAVRHRRTVSVRTCSRDAFESCGTPRYREGYLKVSRRAVHSAASIDRWKIAELLNPRRIPAPPTRRRFFAFTSGDAREDASSRTAYCVPVHGSGRYC